MVITQRVRLAAARYARARQREIEADLHLWRTLAEAHASGCTYRELADLTGLGKSNIHRVLSERARD